MLLLTIFSIMNALEGLSDYLAKLQEYGVDAVIFGDPAVLMTAVVYLSR